jgi:hypothetical protein
VGPAAALFDAGHCLLLCWHALLHADAAAFVNYCAGYQARLL